MKTFKVIGVSLLFCFFSTVVVAQNKGNDKDKDHQKEQKDWKDKDHNDDDGQNKDDRKHDKKDKEYKDRDVKKEHPHKDEHPGKGHAYGRNKGDLSGREFGQARAEEARNKFEERYLELDKNRRIIIASRKRIEEARERNKKRREQNEINEEIFEKRRNVILKAEEELNEFEKSVIRSAEILERNKRELKELVIIERKD